MKLQALPQRPTEYYQMLPKVDLHRHLEGSLRFETVRELAREHGLDLPPTAQLRSMVQVGENEPLTFENFLSKFSTLRLFYRSPEIIARITREAIEDAAVDNVRYMEMRFTPVALSKAQGFSLAEVMDWVITGAREADQDFGTKTRLVASINRHESVALAAQVSYLAAERINQGIVGLDLAGNEADFPAEPFKELLASAQAHGLHLTIHAGEWGAGENIISAIQELGAERIGHGVRILESPDAVALARELHIPLEVCITSNYQSGVIPVVNTHPLPDLISAGLNVTINSDDPSISQIRLSDEYRLACEVLGLTLEQLRERVIAAAEAAFLPPEEQLRLVHALQAEFSQIEQPRL
jgi:adenosine deaminase